MIWDIFAKGRHQRKGRGSKDEFDDLIERIEFFAPKVYRADREIYFYNYRIMHLYTKPLLALLLSVSEKKRVAQDPPGLAREIFLRLKDFYDPKDRLSMEEAKADRGLREKFRQLYVLFYDMKHLQPGDIDTWLKDL